MSSVPASRSAVDEMCAALETGPVTADLNSFGISTMTCSWGRGHRLSVSWFSSGDPYRVVLDGSGYFSTSPDGLRLIAAARRRAASMLEEKITALDEEVR